jgi:hypothetical protein
MGLIQLIVVLAVVGLIVWLVVTYIPMPVIFQRIIIGVAVVCVVLYILRVFGLLGFDIPLQRLR